jgi:glutathione peroxidase
MTDVYGFKVQSIDGREVTLDAYKGKVLLIVNVASKCGFTPQYEGLEKLQESYGEKGFAVLGFPCNQFGSQEPGTEADIQAFCTLNYGVKFPMFSKIDVNGPNAHPLYEYLKKEEPGILGTEAIKWNFTKFLVGKDGKVVKRYAPQTKPEDLKTTIDDLLKA